MQLRYAPDPVRFARMTTEELRANFLVEHLFRPGTVDLVYSSVDRAIIGSAVPESQALVLEAADELRAEYFCQRRELGVLNIGGPGRVTVDDQAYAMSPADCLYVGRGSRALRFENTGTDEPAAFYSVEDVRAVEKGIFPSSAQRPFFAPPRKGK